MYTEAERRAIIRDSYTRPYSPQDGVDRVDAAVNTEVVRLGLPTTGPEGLVAKRSVRAAVFIEREKRQHETVKGVLGREPQDLPTMPLPTIPLPRGRQT